MDEDMLTRVCQKYEKMGHSVQLKTNIIKLNQIKSDTCLQEEVIFYNKINTIYTFSLAIWCYNSIVLIK